MPVAQVLVANALNRASTDATFSAASGFRWRENYQNSNSILLIILNPITIDGNLNMHMHIVFVLFNGKYRVLPAILGSLTLQRFGRTVIS